ncbi:Histidine kinase-, DNA gyrase B-, and HSP90-like ATPase [Cohaesibacter sp. ES.047]|uniref:ATP-binding protein n=1 Tax=Cohaesibacter sp. ES.047 TaxID=1798205 RepID=UPI000BB8641E|nr:ATP-binding protein [Cohaesibacter sp. ES.047]SNY90116.1 Histidine kinase-, DNA gyrase B-, and HSP90-like ATPase [Cohaesibacter sp. ES.047]
MTDAHFRVQVEKDHLKKLASADPIKALSELIWNSVDADATRVDIEIDNDDIAMRSIIVRDNGHGIPHDEIEQLFGSIGGSWKRHGNRSKGKKRILHGKEGKGRLKALALGRSAEWTVRYRSEGGKLLGYKVSLLKDDLIDVRVTEPKEAEPALGTGVEVQVSELDKNYRSLEPANSVQSLSEVFALYLTDYKDVSIFVETNRLDPNKAIKEKASFDLEPLVDGEGGDAKSYPVKLDLIEWKKSTERWFFLCGRHGFPFQRVKPRFQVPGYQFSVYLKSSFIDELQERGELDLAEMVTPALSHAQDAAIEVIKRYFEKKDAAIAKTEIEQWKEEEVYPYRVEPQSSVEVAERKVFDIVALNVNKHLPDFKAQSSKSRAFQMRMLRQAIEKGPDELQHILTEVLELPQKTQREMSRLLEEADLANVISASRLVSDRLKFVHGLEALIFEAESKNLLKERSQLHRMIAEDNTWIFGEEFNLTVDDQSLTEVLRKHQKLIGTETKIDAPVIRVDGKKGIVDLMLSRAVPQSRSDEREHLVVELKRPKCKIGSDEITQVEKYAFTIANDERFKSVKTRWSFWVVSNDLDAYATTKTRQKDQPPGRVFISDDGNIQVWVKSWGEVLQACKARMHFVQEQLKANVDKDTALLYLKKTYDKYLIGVAEDQAEEAEAVEIDV